MCLCVRVCVSVSVAGSRVKGWGGWDGVQDVLSQWR